MTDTTDLTSIPWYFCGIGGSGMLPLAQILHGMGAHVSGSDRSNDQGRTPEKFDWLEEHGFTLFPQDGSGVISSEQVIVASAAVEDTVPEIVRAKELGCKRVTRADLLSTLFNGADAGIAIAGTSGKSTTTAMLGWILYDNDRDPTIMNGAVMKNFATAASPYTSAQVGNGSVFVSEVDESDGSIALYRPAVGLLLNVSLDHKSMEELRQLFGDFLRVSHIRAVNLDDEEVRRLTAGLDNSVSYAIETDTADITVDPASIESKPLSIAATVIDNRDGSRHQLHVAMPGRHNLSNALAAIAAASAADVPVEKAVASLGNFKGLARRFDVIGTTPGAVSVIDDFGHNPEKCAATLRTLKAHPGRIIAFFQPHGYGPLRQMGHELAETFARELGDGDRVLFSDPVYFGGTVDRSEGSERIIRLIEQLSDDAGKDIRSDYIPTRKAIADRIIQLARPGDRIVVMGARDDTLTEFAEKLLPFLP
ncbi:UDP-N-acetylmuramate--alanine ligase [Tsuneonella flava]|uniref:UDP-N-acetylmuramate--alanine ligase n=1 Tax=Tsuneonella flava TaxID=2055955 RepID=A0ABX7K6A2_9SPHN|nr:Mur ligase family protein [Tsuneonella flava]QSB43761.1 UDP-N-acetylmuramate--alanine ligase [Tsuneonella flava]